MLGRQVGSRFTLRFLYCVAVETLDKEIISSISSTYSSLIGSLKTRKEPLKVLHFFSAHFTNLDGVH